MISLIKKLKIDFIYYIIRKFVADNINDEIIRDI